MGFVQVLAGAAAIVLAGLLWRQYAREKAKRANQGHVLFGQALSLFDDAELQRGETAGVWTLTGRYRGQVFQMKSVADTLALRKLPSLWLLVTLPQAQPVTATVDFMMRAVGLASFSNFEFLPHTLPLPGGFPVDATVRSNVPSDAGVLPLLARHLNVFHHGKGKELLISPAGLRIVMQLAEGHRARHGVLREANFGDVAVDPALARQVMDSLIDLQEDLRGHGQA